MRLAEFALAAGADPKWVQNARMLLEREVRYDAVEARRLGLVREIQEAFGTPLAEADAMAGQALGAGSGGAKREVVARTADSGALTLVVDLRRYLTDYAVRLSAARTSYEPKRRGRRARHRTGRAVERAAEYGIDVGLIRDRLRLPTAERLRRLDADRELILGMRGRGAGS